MQLAKTVIGREAQTQHSEEAKVAITAFFAPYKQIWGRALLAPRARLFSIRMIDAASHVLTNIENTPSSPAKKAKISAAAPPPAVTAAAISTLRVKKLTPDATLPKRGSERAAGYDLAR